MEAPEVHQLPYKHLPPSPPPSPPAVRKRYKKKQYADPFLDLGDASVTTLTPSPPSSPKHKPEERESLFTRIIITPILFTSFLFSLFLINRSHRQRRTRTATSLSYLQPSTWISPEPYQDPVGTTWETQGSVSHVAPSDAMPPGPHHTTPESGANKRKSWHLRKKIRKIAKLEISDAFEMRERVIVFMLLVCVLVGWGVVSAAWWVLRKVWQ